MSTETKSIMRSEMKIQERLLSVIKNEVTSAKYRMIEAQGKTREAEYAYNVLERAQFSLENEIHNIEQEQARRAKITTEKLDNQ